MEVSHAKKTPNHSLLKNQACPTISTSSVFSLGASQPNETNGWYRELLRKRKPLHLRAQVDDSFPVGSFQRTEDWGMYRHPIHKHILFLRSTRRQAGPNTQII